jgi:hypothetical protein
METLNYSTATVLVEFDSDFDGVECFVPHTGYISMGGDYLASANIWSSGNWEVTDGYITEAQEGEVDIQIKQFLAGLYC